MLCGGSWPAQGALRPSGCVWVAAAVWWLCLSSASELFCSWDGETCPGQNNVPKTFLWEPRTCPGSALQSAARPETALDEQGAGSVREEPPEPTECGKGTCPAPCPLWGPCVGCSGSPCSCLTFGVFPAGFVLFLCLGILTMLRPNMYFMAPLQEKVVFGMFFLGAVLCLSFSWLFHTVYCHSEKVSRTFSK